MLYSHNKQQSLLFCLQTEVCRKYICSRGHLEIMNIRKCDYTPRYFGNHLPDRGDRRESSREASLAVLKQREGRAREQLTGEEWHPLPGQRHRARPSAGTGVTYRLLCGPPQLEREPAPGTATAARRPATPSLVLSAAAAPC